MDDDDDAAWGPHVGWPFSTCELNGMIRGDNIGAVALQLNSELRRTARPEDRQRVERVIDGFADVFAWGDDEFLRDAFLNACFTGNLTVDGRNVLSDIIYGYSNAESPDEGMFRPRTVALLASSMGGELWRGSTSTWFAAEVIAKLAAVIDRELSRAHRDSFVIDCVDEAGSVDWMPDELRAFLRAPRTDGTSALADVLSLAEEEEWSADDPPAASSLDWISGVDLVQLRWITENWTPDQLERLARVKRRGMK